MKKCLKILLLACLLMGVGGTQAQTPSTNSTTECKSFSDEAEYRHCMDALAEDIRRNEEVYSEFSGKAVELNKAIVNHDKYIIQLEGEIRVSEEN